MPHSFKYVVLLISGIGLLFFILTMTAVLDLSRKEFETEEARLKWWFVSIIPFVGWIFYFIYGAKKGSKPSPTDVSDADSAPPTDPQNTQQ